MKAAAWSMLVGLLLWLLLLLLLLLLATALILPLLLPWVVGAGVGRWVRSRAVGGSRRGLALLADALGLVRLLLRAVGGSMPGAWKGGPEGVRPSPVRCGGQRHQVSELSERGRRARAYGPTQDAETHLLALRSWSWRHGLPVPRG